MGFRELSDAEFLATEERSLELGAGVECDSLADSDSFCSMDFECSCFEDDL